MEIVRHYIFVSFAPRVIQSSSPIDPATLTDYTRISANTCVFLANLEVAIVSTSLVAITDDLQSFERSNWIISSYLLTYTATPLAAGNAYVHHWQYLPLLQELAGERKPPVNCSILQSLLKLTYVELYFVLSSLPLGVVTMALLVLFMPAGFPDLNAEKRTINFGKLGEIDYLGATLIFATSAFIVSALQEAGTTFAWSSATIIVLIVLTESGNTATGSNLATLTK
ncbi:major facilitator superfamily transporter protein [Rutstroemia sp. NJR-2017a BBW]|nr:major facilitator superfamily transporter protein [Rutstroemia sp. NJR-2017a BBW]